MGPVVTVAQPLPCSQGALVKHHGRRGEWGNALWEGRRARRCRGAEICAVIRLSLSFPFSAGLCCHHPPPTFPLLPHDRGAARAAGVRDTCQQGDRVSSESVPCPSHSHVDWQPASADYRHCGSKRNPLWQWQAYDLQDMLILSNQHFIQRLRPCHPSLENILLGR